MSRVRIGILGAARITPNALIHPAGAVEEANIVAIAARDPERAMDFAAKHSIPNVYDTYDQLIEDDGIDAIYNPLPNSHHAPYTLKAIAAGKHVLCEKPFTSNGAEAEEVKAAADANPHLVVMEAFHYRYHPLMDRILTLIADGAIGDVHHIETAMCFPLFKKDDIRWQLDLAGGTLMDAGCYAVHALRTLAGTDHGKLTARALRRSGNRGVDRYMRADIVFDDGRTGRITASMWSSTLLKISAYVVGSKGEIRVFNPFAPHMFHRLKVNGKREKVDGEATYTHQLRAFTSAVLHQTPILTGVDDALSNMRLIDAIYRAAGMEPRPSLLASAN